MTELPFPDPPLADETVRELQEKKIVGEDLKERIS